LDFSGFRSAKVPYQVGEPYGTALKHRKPFCETRRMWVYWQAELPRVEDIQLLKEARIEVITEKYRPETESAVLRNTEQPLSERSNSVYRSENASFRGEKIHDWRENQ